MIDFDSLIPRIVQSLISIGPVAAVIGLVLFLRWNEQRRARNSDRMTDMQDRLLRQCITSMEQEYSARIGFVETWFEHLPSDDLPGNRHGRLEILFIVETAETEHDPKIYEAFQTLQEEFQRELLLSGYFKNSREAVSMILVSRERMADPYWRF